MLTRVDHIIGWNFSFNKATPEEVEAIFNAAKVNCNRILDLRQVHGEMRVYRRIMNWYIKNSLVSASNISSPSLGVLSSFSIQFASVMEKIYSQIHHKKELSEEDKKIVNDLLTGLLNLISQLRDDSETEDGILSKLKEDCQKVTTDFLARLFK